MERTATLLITSICAAPLFYFATSWMIVVMNQGASGPDARLGVAYLSTWLGFAAVPVGFFVVWFLTSRFLLPQYLRYVQLVDALAFIAWSIVLFNFLNQQPQRLTYADHSPVLDIELRATESVLKQQPIDSIIEMDYIGGTDFTVWQPNPVRKEASVSILSWRTVPYEVDKWQMRVFLRNQPVLFPLDLPRFPRQSTDWSGWIKPAPYQDTPLPEDAQANLSLRYRFRLVPHGQDL